MKNLYRTLSPWRILVSIAPLLMWQNEKLFAQHLSLNVYGNQTEITATESITLIDGFHIPPGKTVRIFVAPSFKVCTPIAWTPSNGQNYIRSRTFKVPGVTFGNLDSIRNTCEVNQTVQYFDGLGRYLQIIDVQGSPSFRDIVQPMAYDGFGREAKKYLPYASALLTSNGSFKSSSLADQKTYFSNPDAGVKTIDSAFSESRFEYSPLSRVLEQSAPGLAWRVGGGHTQKNEYGSNNSSTAYSTTGFAVRRYNADSGPVGQEYKRVLSGTGYFDLNSLFLTVNKDENWVSGKPGTMEEYKDKDGRVVLKRTFTATGALSTYYVYDHLGNLNFVLPPGANPDAEAIPDQNKLDNFCYQYQYDDRKRLIRKKIPGKGWEEMIYNPLDQLVFSQDAVQAQATGSPYPYRSFIKYDMFGRVVMTGVEKDHTGTREVVQDYVNNVTTGFWETRDNSPTNYHGYNNISCPWNTLSLEPEVVNYYDDYNIPGIPDNQSSSYSLKTKGLLTASKTKVLGTTSDFLWTVNYYDDEGRVVKVWKQHYQGGVIAAANYDDISNTYNFAGELINSSRIHKVGSATTDIAVRYQYDHMGRKKAVMESVNGQPEVILSKLDYNEIGQLSKKDLHSTNNGTNFIQSSSYAYNERGWMTKINDPNNVTANKVFGMELTYANKADAYNGNIGGIKWQTKVPSGLGLYQQVQSFSYDYDKLNRLVKAAYTTSGLVDKFNEELAYDDMGNITALKRKNAISGYLNNLSYNYLNAGVKGNRLLGVTDAGTAAQSSNYTYDLNGNQKTDSRKGINITYNHLNLPQVITKAGQSVIYTYDAAGNKLRKVLGSNSRDYIDGIEYNNGAIEFIQTEEGRALPGVNYSYEYMLKDHLGNTRAVVKQNGDITQVQDYYAFGMEMASGNTFSSSPNNLYKYNGKEKQGELGLDQLDYGARFYDPVIGRWNVVDPKASILSAISPYVYSLDNPIRYVDPDGEFPIDITLRSFAPYNYFGGGFKGDGSNRRFSTSSNASSKLHATTRIETDNMSIVSQRGYDVISKGGYGLWSAISDTKVSSSMKGNSLTMRAEAGNDAAIPFMDVNSGDVMNMNIDNNANLKFGLAETKGGNQILSITGEITGDHFPSGEAFVTDSKGNSVFLGVSDAGAFATKDNALAAPWLSLGGKGDTKMANVNVSIIVNSKGKFLGIQGVNGKIISIKNWNKQFEHKKTVRANAFDNLNVVK